MKRIFTICFLLLLLSAVAAAQRRTYLHLNRVNGYSIERLQLQRDVLRYRIAQRQAARDGLLAPYEKRKLQWLRRKTRRDAVRFRYHQRNRVI